MSPRNKKNVDLLSTIFIAYKRSPLGRSLGHSKRYPCSAVPQFRRYHLARRFLKLNTFRWQERRKQWSMSLARYIYSWRTPTVPVPAQAPVKVVCIADTHTRELQLPSGDILIHAGDLTQQGTFDELQRQLDWLNSLPHQHKVVIAGNHDLLLDPEYSRRVDLQEPGKTRFDLKWGDIIYLEDQMKDLQLTSGRTVRVFGSPQSPGGDRLAFGYFRWHDIWYNKIPERTDILVTHGPPRGHLDVIGRPKRHVGCKHLLKELWRIRPTLAVFGHIHSSYGQELVTFGAIDDAFEDIVVRQGSFSRCLDLFGLLVRQRFWSTLGFSAQNTEGMKLVNAAVGGPISRNPKDATVVQI